MANLSWEWNMHYQKALMPNTVFLALEMILGIAGNSLVLFIYIFKMKNIVDDRYFIPVLAVLDIIASTVSTSFYISDSLNWVAYSSGGLCKFFFFMTTFSSGASAHVLFIISLQRYLKICRPTGRQMTLLWKRISVGIIIVLSFIYAAPLLYYSDTGPVWWTYNGDNVTGTMCLIAAKDTGGSELYYFATLSVIVVANVIGTVAMYAPIGYVIYRRFTLRKRSDSPSQSKRGVNTIQIDESIQDTTGSTDASDDVPKETIRGSVMETSKRVKTEEIKRKRSKRDKNVQTNFNHMFFAIVVFYVVSYIPTFVFIFLVRIYDDFWFNLTDGQLGVCVFLSRMLILNHIVNPFIYGYYDVKFRTEVHNLRCTCPSKAGKYGVRND